jgi:hypothetical protein
MIAPAQRLDRCSRVTGENRARHAFATRWFCHTSVLLAVTTAAVGLPVSVLPGRPDRRGVANGVAPAPHAWPAWASAQHGRLDP